LKKPIEFFRKSWNAPEADRIDLEETHEKKHTLLKRVICQLEESKTTLEEKSQALEQALKNLQAMQAKLVASEKMSALGVLVAGVAHEINNPVNFIYGNLIHAQKYTQDLLQLVQLYQHHYPNPTSEIQEAIAAIELDFLSEDLIKLLNSMNVGTERIREIVKSLRTFSRLNEAEYKVVDIHEGLDSTLMILHNRLKAKSDHPGIEVLREYGQLPLVECCPGQLNQVFMNILSNAIDALDEKISNEKKAIGNQDKAFLSPIALNSTQTLPYGNPYSTRYAHAATNGFFSEYEECMSLSPTITISTEVLQDNWVAIRIADNGLGMNEEVYSKLFDPFFTTKPVGQGTGLGLSISYQIVVEKHGGKMQCNSAPGQGAEFVIQIPVQQSIRKGNTS
jgi:signal transduction histidine kinase